MTSSQQLETLSDLFPSYPRSELAARLLCLNSLDSVVEELLCEQRPQTSSRKYPEEVVKLAELFPQYSTKKISQVYHQSGQDSQVAFNSLLAGDTLIDVAQICGLTDKEVQPYLSKYNNDPLTAIADIIANHKKTRKAWTSRVQDRKSAVVTGVVLPVDTASLRELQEIILANEELKKLNYDFLVKLLAFFGNVDKTISVAQLFIDHSDTTFLTSLGYVPKECPQVGPKAADVLKKKHVPFQTVSPKPRNAVLCAWKPNTNTLSSKSSTVHTTVSLPPPSSKIDLHGLTVAQAISVTKNAVSDWWLAELAARVEHGLIDKHGTKVSFVEPLCIITGRGLHSSGGPKIRHSVIKMLNQNGYVYEEEVGQLYVMGRRK